MFNDDFFIPSKELNRYQLAKLHTFEVAARYQSFAMAAQELSLTPSAISHQINNLESELGFKLFKRFHRHIELTDEGKSLFRTLQTLLHKLNQEVIDIRANEISGQLDIYCRPSIAQCWLVPRLHKFTQQYPSIKLNLLTGNENIDFNRHKIDLAIYYGDSLNNDPRKIELMPEFIIPVCSPEYAKKHHLHNSTIHLKHCTFLHDSQAWEHDSLFKEWEVWAIENKFDYDFSQLKYILFDRSDLAITAAINHMGIALGRKKLIAEYLKIGKLIIPFEGSAVQCSAHYYLFTPYIQKPKVYFFVKWLKQEALIP